jgi:hypothetical protein
MVAEYEAGGSGISLDFVGIDEVDSRGLVVRTMDLQQGAFFPSLSLSPLSRAKSTHLVDVITDRGVETYPRIRCDPVWQFDQRVCDL